MMVQAIEADARALPTFNFDPVSLDDVLPQITFTDDEKKRVNTILCRETGLASPPRIVLLNANCSDLMPLRRWPTDRYIQLARQLTDTFSDVWIGFTGAPEDESAINELLHGKDLPRCINLAGKTSLRELLVLYGFCELLITNDSGPAHFAAMTPIDVITLFGPETPRLFAAPSPRNHVLWAGIACSPCVNAFNDRQTSCRDNVCMQRITLDQVFDLACEIYRRRVGS
jgi:ADP-heptose:LPS heptosyltransferase